MDGNDATERNAGWTPSNATPMYPEYLSQAAIVAGVSARCWNWLFRPRKAYR